MKECQRTRREFLVATGAAALGILSLASPSGNALTSNYHRSVLAKHPIAYWRLGEIKGPTAFDAAENGHFGTFHGTPSYREAGAIKHDPDTAIKLDGRRSYIEVPDSKDFSHPTSGQGLTVEAWIRPDILVFDGETKDPHVHWLGKGDTGQFEWALRFYSKKSTRPNRISAYIWNPAGGLGAGAYFQDKLKPGEWIHVVACYDLGDETNPKAGVSIYKNGVLRGGPATQPGALYREYNVIPVHGVAPLRLGTRDLKSFLVGALDEVAIYPRVLKSAEILENYRSGI
ncbi:MAG TPA: LamG domain-containing protein [Pyrinomonadaceae bacterium]